MNTRHSFSHVELAVLMIKKLDLHEGLWHVVAEVGMVGTEIGIQPNVSPGAMVSFLGLGLARIEPRESNSLTVDAAKVNPLTVSEEQKRMLFEAFEKSAQVNTSTAAARNGKFRIREPKKRKKARQ